MPYLKYDYNPKDENETRFNALKASFGMMFSTLVGLSCLAALFYFVFSIVNYFDTGDGGIHVLVSFLIVSAISLVFYVIFRNPKTKTKANEENLDTYHEYSIVAKENDSKQNEPEVVFVPTQVPSHTEPYSSSRQPYIFCHKCGTKTLEDSMFCQSCGTKLQ